MRKLLLSVSVCFFAAGTVFAQNIPFDASVRTGTLPNGMKYYIKKNTKPEKKVEMRLAINAGSILEDENQQGLAHFMEHMNFNGSKNFPGNKLVDALQTIGVKFGQHLNAYTSFDETVYMLPVPLDKTGNLDLGLKVMEDWAFNASLTDEEINKERGVVLEELRLGLGPDKKMADRYLPKMLYNSQYANRLPIGKKNILETFKPDVIRQFHKDWYRPDLMALVIVGDINVDEIEQKVKANFGKYQNPKTEKPRKDFDLPNHKETMVSIETEPDATRSMVQLMYKDHDNYKPEITVADYDKGISERLFSAMLNNRLRELINSNNPPFTFGSSSHGGTYARNKEAFQSFAITKDGGQLAALKVLMEETERARRFGFTQAELDRAKAQMLSNMERSYNNRDKTESADIVDELVRNFLEKEPAPGISWEYNEYKNALPKITLEQVNAIGKDYVTDDNRVVIITGPKKDAITQPTEAQVLALFDEVKKENLKPYEEKVAIKELVKPFKATGKIVKTETDAKLGTTTFTLNNGAKLTYKKTDFKDDEIVFAARSLGGSSLVSDADIAKTQWAFPALAEAGINGYSKNDLGKYLSGKQVSLVPSVSGLTTSLNGKSSVKDFETLMQLVYSYFTNLNYDPAAFNAYKEKQSSVLANMMNNPQVYYQGEVQKYLNQKNPRFTGILPTDADWAKTDYKLAYDIYKQKVANAGNFQFYLVGNVDDAKVRQLAEQYLGSLPSTGKPETFKDNGYRQMISAVNKVIKKGTDPKAQVNIMINGVAPYNEKDDLALTALGEVATIKVIEKLREEESGIYGGGARGGMNKVPYGSYNFSLSFPCGPENAEKLTKSALAELQKLIDKGPEQKDLDKFKEGEINDDKSNVKDNSYWMNALTTYQLEQGDRYEILNYLDKVKALTVQDLQRVAKKYLDKDKMVFTLMPENLTQPAQTSPATTANTTSASTTSTAGVTPQSVINNYITALGGRQKLEAVKTMKTTAEMAVSGMTLEMVTLQAAPNKMKMVQKMMGQEVGNTVFDGTAGFTTQMGQKMDLKGAQLDALKNKRIFDALEMNPANYKTVETVTEDGKTYYLLSDGKSKKYFDTQTGLLAKGTAEMGDMKVLEYKTVDGIKVPSKMEVSAMGQSMVMTVKEILFNQGVSDADFK